MELPRGEVMIIATGGQGEPRAALARIADGTHQIELDAGDVVLFSSRQIPGNEIAIGRIQNQLAERGHRRSSPTGRARSTCPAIPAGPSCEALYGWLRPEDPRAGAWRDAPHARAGPARQGQRHSRRRSSRRTAIWSASRPASRASSAKCAPGGWCSTATSSRPPMARRWSCAGGSRTTGC